MADISSWNIHGVEYDLADASARADISELQENTGAAEKALFHQDGVFNSILTPASNGSGDAVTGAEWNVVTILTNINVKAGMSVKFIFTIPTALSTNGYVTIRNSDGTSITTDSTFSSGQTRLEIYRNLNYNVVDGYAQIRFGAANVTVHAEYKYDVPMWSDVVNSQAFELGSHLMTVAYPWYEVGSIDSTSGGTSSNSARIRTVDYIDIDSFISYMPQRVTGYSGIVFAYNSSKSFLGKTTTGFETSYQGRQTVLNVYPAAKYVKAILKRDDGATMTSTDIAACRDVISVGTVSDTVKSLSKAVTYSNLVQGSINGDTGADTAGTTRCRTVDYISIDDFVYCDMASHPDFTMFAFVYASDKSLIQRFNSNWQNFSFSREEVLSRWPTAKFVRVAFAHTGGSGTITYADITSLHNAIYVKPSVLQAAEAAQVKARFDKQFNYIAYSALASSLNDAPANTKEHFLNCAENGKFTALKGDVRPTSDGGIIMCHDAGYTFDENDEITTYVASSSTPISTLTVAECEALIFAQKYNGQDCHPIDFETYIRICKKYGLIAFVTVRDEQIATVVAPVVMGLLKKYRMVEHAVINSFTKASLEAFRSYSSTIMLSLVLNHNAAPTTSDVDFAVSIGNCLINLFDVPLPSGATLESVLTSYATVLDYAYSQNVLVYEAQTGNRLIDTMMEYGVMGSQMYDFPDYDYVPT